MRPWLIVLALALLFAGALGCVVPPKIEKSNVLPQKEIEILSLLKRGKDYSASGRYDLAEREFRLALRRRSRDHTIFNDLGYVLQAQNRLSESEAMYRKGLSIQPNNVVLIENLARLQYRQGQFGPAIKSYRRLLDHLHFLAPELLQEQLGEEFNQAEFSGIYRNLGMSYYTLGIIDEAACYSALAFIVAPSIYEAGRHSRLLFAVNRVDIALPILRDTVIARQGNVPPKILLDYGIALYIRGDYTLAKTSLSRVLQQTGGTRVDRRTARLLKLLIALRSKKNREKEIETLYDGLFEEDARFCEREELDKDNYWPLRLSEEIAELRMQLCDEEKQPFLKN